MSNTKHTPGPWTAQIPHNQANDTNVLAREAADGSDIVVAWNCRPQDAALIAASTELAESADAFLRWFRVFVGREAYNEIRSDEIDNFKAALAKAGVTP